MSYEWDDRVDIEEMVGQTFVSIERGEYDGNDALKFTTEDGTVYEFVHSQDCCESVYIESIVGELSDLVGVRLNMAEEVSCDLPPPGDYEPESYTWTFYKFATIKGYVDVRWFGSSNGYYSEGVSLYKHRS